MILGRASMPAVAVTATVASFAAAACGSDDAATAPASVADAGPCTFETATHEDQGAAHIDPRLFDPAIYNSNPPSSGPHCNGWGDWRAYDRPLPRCNWIHNLEHGGIVVTWKCAEACPNVTTALAEVARGAADDICAPARVLVTPDPDAPTTIAAAAWGSTFRATCLDDASRAALAAFIDAHIGTAGKAPERTSCPGGGASP